MGHTASALPPGVPNLLDPQIYLDGTSRRIFAEIREKYPVFRHPDPSEDGGDCWAVVSWAACSEVYRQHKVFRSEIYNRPQDGRRFGGTAFDTYPRAHTMGMEHTLIHMDPPTHTAAKQLVVPKFREAEIERLKDKMREYTRDAIRGIAHQGECDFVQDVAIKIPARVLMFDMFGATPESLEVAKKMSSAVFGYLDENLLEGAGATAEELTTQLRGLIMEQMDDRRQNPRADLLTYLAHAEIDGKSLEGESLWELTNGIIFAGFDTTVDSIGLGMAKLFECPDQVQRLRDDLTLVPTAVEEMLRYGSAVLVHRRTSRARYELCGQVIEPDEKIALFLQSANMDPREFPEPDVFDVGRKPNRHLTLGHGLHRCLGAYLTKAEISILIEETLANFDEIEINGPVDPIKTVWVTGLKRLPVSFKVNPNGPAFANTALRAR